VDFSRIRLFHGKKLKSTQLELISAFLEPVQIVDFAVNRPQKSRFSGSFGACKVEF
jgi:hypothetical protein